MKGPFFNTVVNPGNRVGPIYVYTAHTYWMVFQGVKERIEVYICHISVGQWGGCETSHLH